MDDTWDDWLGMDLISGGLFMVLLIRGVPVFALRGVATTGKGDRGGSP